MREIKFRAWDNILNKMFNWEQIQFSNKVTNVPIFEMADHRYMQFTGLKDSKNVEIYEGDIIIYPARSKDKKHAVVFENGGFTAGDTFPLGCVDEFIEEDMELEVLDTERFIEVIGNIYENKELLK